MDDQPPEDFNKTTQSTTAKPKSKKLPSDCRICGAPALYSYFGAIVCDSCKIFFRRNAPKQSSHFTCHFDGHCEVNINTRHLCAACRLAKCFENGMQADLIRAPRTAKTDKNTKKKSKENKQPEKLPTLNLLDNDQSTLTTDEWNLLSNVMHCYDEASGITAADGFLQKQNELPPKMRFKTTSVIEFLKPIMIEGQHLYERNADFICLSSHDRSILLHNTVKYVAAIGTCLIGRAAHIFDNPTFYESFENIYGSAILSNSIRALNLIDADGAYFKLILALLTFSTFDQMNYTNNTTINFEDIKRISNTQDKYVDLAWRYVVYKCGYERAVICFSNLIKMIFALNNAFVELTEHKQYMDMVDSLIKQTEETLTLTE